MRYRVKGKKGRRKRGNERERGEHGERVEGMKELLARVPLIL